MMRKSLRILIWVAFAVFWQGAYAQNAELIDSDQSRSSKPTSPFIVNNSGKLTLTGSWIWDYTSDGKWYAIQQNLSHTPTEGETVEGNTAIAITFNEPVDMTSVDGGITVKNDSDQFIAGTWSQAGSVLTFLPEELLFPGEIITVQINESLVGSTGLWVPIQYEWSFQVNDQPIFTSLDSREVDENETAIGAITGVGRQGTTLSYSIVGGLDQTLFQLSGSELAFQSDRNYESPEDANQDNIYEVTIRMSDGTLFNDQNLSVTITNVNEPPVFTSQNTVTNYENQFIPLIVTADDPDEVSEFNTITYSIIGGVDLDDFVIDPTDGTLRFVAIPDFDIPSDSDLDNVYQIQVQATDGEFIISENLSITVTNIPAFVTRWRVIQEGGNRYVKLPLTNGDSDEDYAITWGDGTISYVTTPGGGLTENVHYYPSNGSDEYIITIEGDISGWATGVYPSDSWDNLEEVISWGPFHPIASNAGEFKNATNLEITAVDILDLSRTTRLSSFFENCSSITNIPFIDTWDVAHVTDMSAMFRGATKFNAPLNSWLTGNVSSMNDMFHGAAKFNQDIGNWDVSSVRFMIGMFEDATSFNQDLNLWNVSAVNDFSSTFSGASAFNGNISNWDVSSSNSFNNMFDGATLFDQNINGWDVSQATHFISMFQDAESFNQDLDNWRLENAYDMLGMFRGATAFNGIVTTWQPNNVWRVAGMFTDATSFNQEVNWYFAAPTHANGMFTRATSFDKVVTLDISNVTNLSAFFAGATSYNQPLSLLNGLNVEILAAMFSGATAFNQPVTLVTGNVTNMSSMFQDAISFNQQFPASFRVDNVSNMNNMFKGATSFSQGIFTWNVESLTSAQNMLDNTAITTAQYDRILDEWSDQNVQSGVGFGAAGLEYCNRSAERDVLIAKGWFITGDALSCASARSAVNLTSEDGTEDVSEAIQGVSIYPNPAKAHFTLELEKFEGAWATISNLSGKILTVPVELVGPKTEFDLTGINDRILFLHIDQPDGAISLRILRQD